MATLVIVRGPNAGRQFALDQDCVEIGRHASSDICLEAQAVSRHHARIWRQDGRFFIEDRDSSNGTYLNGKKLKGKAPLVESDALQIGPYSLSLRTAPDPEPRDGDLIVRSTVSVDPSSHSLHGVDPAHKLQVILEIAQHLGRTLDLEDLLDKLLAHLLRLFPQADRGVVLLLEGERLRVRAQQSRRTGDPTTLSYSRTIVNRALLDGIGLLSDDIHSDQRFDPSASLSSLDVHSVMCVPLLGQGGKRLGVVQLDRYKQGKPFLPEDLQLLTVVAIQVSVVLENVALHAELLREERLRQELAMARDIQLGFLSTDYPLVSRVGFELFARVWPAREVAGDLYDFFPLADGRYALLLGDVSGKGMPAALFMIAVRTLGRHLALAGEPPSVTLTKLNDALAADNPSGMFVTLVYAIYNPRTGEAVVTSAGHPKPLVRSSRGCVTTCETPTGRPLGFDVGKLGLVDTSLTINPGDTLIFYTDGFFEARTPDGTTMFGVERFRNAISGPRTDLPLEACAEQVRLAVERFTGAPEQQDDLTLLMLRRT
jgi:serine phosphatase RsbU (regulator of sigma subunit)